MAGKWRRAEPSCSWLSGWIGAAFLISIAHAGQPTLTLRDRPDISVVMDIQPNSCSAVVPITIQSSKESDFREASKILSKVMAWAQVTVSTNCPDTNAIQLRGTVSGQTIYQGMAERTNDWALSETALEKSASSTHLSSSTASSTVSPRDDTVDPPEAARDQLRLGEQYAYGEGVPRDSEKAVKLFRLAAEQGNPEAQYKLAVMLEQGQGIAQDFQSAFDWYSKAAKQGHAGAKNNIGVMYEKGRGVPVNPKEAVTWYLRAAALGLGSANYNLGDAYLRGNGVKKNKSIAIKYFKLAENQGTSEASKKLAEIMKSVAPTQSVQSYKPEGLNTRDLAQSEIYQRMYYGHFAKLRSRHRFEVEHFKYLFVHSAMAYGIKCPDALAADSPTVAITAADVDGWGNKFNYQTRRYTIDTRFYEKASEYGVPHNFGYGGELLLLFQHNHCVSQEIIQYLENLLRFAYNQPPIQEKAPQPIKRYQTKGKVDPHPADVLAKLRILRRPE